jgi:hypothetical protein
LIWQCVGGQETRHEETKEHAETSIAEKPNEMTNSAHQSQMTSHPSRVNIEFRVNAKKVVELRKELRARDIDTNGLKKQLQARLRQAMFDEMDTEQNEAPVPPKVESVQHAPAANVAEAKQSEAPIVHEDGNNDAQMIDVNEVKADEKSVVSQQITTVAHSKPIEPPIEKSASKRDEPAVEKALVQPESPSPMPVERHVVVGALPKQQMDQGSTSIKQYWKSFSKPAQATASSPMKEPALTNSPMKNNKSPIRMVVKNTQKTCTAPSEIDISSHDLMITQCKSDLSEDDFERPVSDFSAASGSASMSKAKSVRDLVSKIQNCNTFTSTTSTTEGGSTSALSKNLQAKKDARLARMAEIRGKVRPLLSHFCSTFAFCRVYLTYHKTSILAEQTCRRIQASTGSKRIFFHAFIIKRCFRAWQEEEFGRTNEREGRCYSYEKGKCVCIFKSDANITSNWYWQEKSSIFPQ